MARPLILHNVPDDELYVGDDGIQRPFAMVFPEQEGPGRARRAVSEKGSFGKSTRRSRSKTGTPARREDPTIAAADKIFSSWANTLAPNTAAPATTNTAAQRLDDTTTAAPAAATRKEPTEVVLRGYRSPEHQYAALNHFEQIAGRICEDYPREPPFERRRYKSELRDPAYTKRRPLTPEEREKVNRIAAGQHWVKVTFESAEAADNAIYASPQSVLGHLVYAELYRGGPPTRDEAIPDVVPLDVQEEAPRRRRKGTTTVDTTGFTSAMLNPDSFEFTPPPPRQTRNLQTAAFMRDMLNPDAADFSPPRSLASTRTADTGTVASTAGTATTGTVTGQAALATGFEGGAAPERQQQQQQQQQQQNDFCTVIPNARKIKVLPVEQALLPAPSATQRLLARVPFLGWFSGSIIGNEVPRTDTGEFDWYRASLYWKLIFWLDLWFGLFRKEIVSADKDE
ncbi:hypothetical protein QBC47DRAFT_411173 [Echria macrotheca]|uniref:Nucleoporin NUP53 n=1 Tax=Echria macrotheca TaxID=438768 RepID=A0AAJ0BHQ2_9PEZI|nr:hypothetical protein QBC47DRAFT_411173 [Echria macrotheca]